MGLALADNYEDIINKPPSSWLTNSIIKSSNPVCSPSSLSPSRLWRPRAQRNVKNQWSKILFSKDHWASASSKGRSHATGLVNSYLEQRYMPVMNLGVLKDMPRIIEEACSKLTYNQELFGNKLVSTYKDMVIAVNDLVKASYSMRYYLKGSASSPFIQYSNFQEDPNDSGDGGEIPVFSFLSIKNFEDLACELVYMFRRELSLKRVLVIALLSINCLKDVGKDGVLGWSDEIYHGEFDDLRACEMLVQDSYPINPQIKDWEPVDPLNRTSIKFANREALEAYLVIWISDLNIEKHRVHEIFSIVEEEMRDKVS